MNIKELFCNASNEMNAGKPFVLAIVINSSGSSPSTCGRWMIIGDNKNHGSIGGGSVEKEAIDNARKMIKNNEPLKKISIDLSGNEGSDGICGGSVEVMLIFYCLPEIILIGAGHVNQAVNNLASFLGYRCNIYDRREGIPPNNYAQIIDFNEIKNIDEKSMIVIACHSHKEDELALRYICRMKKEPAYLGVVASRKKIKQIVDNFKKAEIKLPTNLFSPAGLNISGKEPAQVALSIVAQIEKIRYNKDAADMNEVK